jgi:hypothetical protein
MPSVNMNISPTSQPIISDPTIMPSLSSYAAPPLSWAESQTTNRRSQRKKKSIIVSLRNWEGEEISDVTWPLSFVPFPPSLTINEQTLSTDTLSTLYALNDSRIISTYSFLILPLKNYSHLPHTFDDHEIQRILHKYRIKYSPDDLLGSTPTQATTQTISVVEEDDLRDRSEDIPDENDLREADRLASLLSMNFDDDDEQDGGHEKISLDAMLSDLTNKLSYFENSNESNNQRFGFHSFLSSFFLVSLTLSLSLHHSPEDSDQLLPVSGDHFLLPPTLSSYSNTHTNLYKGLAEQIYFAELDAEDYFQCLTRYPLTPQDILFLNQSSSDPTRTHSLSPLSPSSSLPPLSPSSHKEFELTSELSIPPNRIIGQIERVSVTTQPI